MTDSEIRQKLLDQFAQNIEIRQPNIEQALAVPTADLQAAEQQANTTYGQLLRPDSNKFDPAAVVRPRYPALQGIATRFAQGLEKNPEFTQETFISPQDLFTAVALDQAIGRILYAGQLLALGGATGQVLAGAAAQKMIDDTLADARARILDTSIPGDTRSDIGALFTESFRLEDEENQRRAQQQQKTAQAAQPYQTAIDQAQGDAALTEVVDAYLSSVQNQGVTKA